MPALTDTKTMTVTEVIAKLSKLRDQHGWNVPVFADGCDCEGPARDVVFLSDRDPSGYILVSRQEAKP